MRAAAGRAGRSTATEARVEEGDGDGDAWKETTRKRTATAARGRRRAGGAIDDKSRPGVVTDEAWRRGGGRG